MLKLRKYNKNDGYDLYLILRDAETVKYEMYDVQTLKECELEAGLRSCCDSYKVIELDDMMIGSLYYSNNDCEFGIILNRDYWKCGYGYQASKLFIDTITDNPIYARCYKDNIASRRLLEKLEFKMINENEICDYILERLL